MPGGLGRFRVSSFALVVMLTAAWPLRGQDTKAPYPSMASLDQYLIERNAEIPLARSAAPASISNDADVMVLGRHGYETAVKGKNGFVCMVWRSWAAGIDDPDSWNPKLRAPVCFNTPAARFNVPLLAGRCKIELQLFRFKLGPKLGTFFSYQRSFRPN